MTIPPSPFVVSLSNHNRAAPLRSAPVFSP
jgi:hypothetical protein